MSVTNQVSRIPYEVTGSLTYPIPFFFEKNEHVKVYLDDALISSGYSISGAGDESGGSLVFLSPPEGASLVILRQIPLTQENSFNDGGPLDAAVYESMFDRQTYMAQQLDEKINRTIKLPVSNTTLDPQMTGEITPDSLLMTNDDGTGLKIGPNIQAYSDLLDSKVASAQAAETSAINAKNDAENSATSATESESNAEASMNSAANSAAEAQASMVAAQHAANQQMWRDVIFLTQADSPFGVLEEHRSKMIAIDCSLGPVVVNLPQITSIDLTHGFAVGIKKTDSSGNSITVNRSGDNTIDGGIYKTIGSADSGATFIADADPVPDAWTSAQFGASAGNLSCPQFIGNGVETTFDLGISPGSENNTFVFIGGVYQDKASYDVLDTYIVFSEAPPSGLTVDVIVGTTLPIGIPSDGTVTLAKLAQEVLDFLIPVGTPIWSILDTPPAGYISGMNKTIGKTGADYTLQKYFNLYSKIWAMAGLSTTAGDPFRISSAKGASALADWDAGKLITIDFQTNEVFIRTKGTGRNLGSYQADEIKSHTHSIVMAGGAFAAAYSVSQVGGASVAGYLSAAVQNTGGAETRPKNVAMNLYIKY